MLKARFIDPMLLLKTDSLPEGMGWRYEMKTDAYCALAFKSAGTLYMRSRSDNDFALRYPEVLKGLARLPNETVLDGEVVALGKDGKPSFNALQNIGSRRAPVLYYVFDVLMLSGKDLTNDPLSNRLVSFRRASPRHSRIRRAFWGHLDGHVRDLIRAVKRQGFEGLVAKRLDSRYEAGLRSGAWTKMRVNRGQEFVLGGYTTGTKPLDALIFGYYQDGQLIYVARTRNGFTPTSRRALFKKFEGLETTECPFVNVPEAKTGRSGAGLTKSKMADCRWLKPVLVAQFEFLEWTGKNSLRHSKFIALRDDKKPEDVRRE